MSILMDKPMREAEPFFTQPVRQVTMMLIVSALVGVGAYVAYGPIFSIFIANPYLNGLILGVFILGVLTCFWQVAQLMRSVSWIEGFAAHRPGHEITIAPRLLAPLAALLRSRGPRSGQISSSSARSILESVATRIDEARDITRYLASLLIFLGLLGTFYGLAITVPAVVDTIRALAPQEGETGTQVFDKLMSGLEAQLGGMGTAFSSSLFGLAGSLVLGFLDLQAGQAQNRFYNELEEWLSTVTSLSEANPDAPSMLGETSRRLRNIEQALAGGGEGANATLMALAGQISALTEQLRSEQQLVRQIAQNQEALRPVLEQLARRLDGRS